MNNSTKDQIAREAEEKWYEQCGGCGAKKPIERCIGCFHNFEQGKVDAYIAGAETWAERGEVLKIAMLKAANDVKDLLNPAHTSPEVAEKILEIELAIKKAIANYNNPVK